MDCHRPLQVIRTHRSPPGHSGLRKAGCRCGQSWGRITGGPSSHCWWLPAPSARGAGRTRWRRGDGRYCNQQWMEQGHLLTLCCVWASGPRAGVASRCAPGSWQPVWEGGTVGSWAGHAWQRGGRLWAAGGWHRAGGVPEDMQWRVGCPWRGGAALLQLLPPLLCSCSPPLAFQLAEGNILEAPSGKGPQNDQITQTSLLLKAECALGSALAHVNHPSVIPETVSFPWRRASRLWVLFIGRCVVTLRGTWTLGAFGYLSLLCTATTSCPDLNSPSPNSSWTVIIQPCLNFHLNVLLSFWRLYFSMPLMKLALLWAFCSFSTFSVQWKTICDVPVVSE